MLDGKTEIEFEENDNTITISSEVKGTNERRVKKIVKPIQVEFFTCACNDNEHLLQISYDPDENDLWVEVHLGHQSLPKRIWNAIKYVFGYKCKYGCFESWLLDEKHTDRMIEVLKKKRNKDRKKGKV